MASSSELRENVLDALWSQWRELGVSGTIERRHSDDFIDPEPLIAFTAVHSDLDPRLRDESIDWVLRYETYLSKARLKNVLTDQGLLEDARFREYAATLNAHGGSGWPVARGTPLAFRSRARSPLDDLARPALISLRMRAVFGVGARAELLRVFLARPGQALTAADLSAETSYGKRNVLNELEPLRAAGLVKSFRAANADRFLLASVDRLVALIGPVPRRFSPWTRIFAALHVLLGVAREGANKSSLQRAVDAVHLLEEHRTLFAAAGMYVAPLPPGPSAWPAFLEWAADQARAIARA